MQNSEKEEIFLPGKHPSLLKSKWILLLTSEEPDSHSVSSQSASHQAEICRRFEGVRLPLGQVFFSVGSNLSGCLWLTASPTVVFRREERGEFPRAVGGMRKGLKEAGGGEVRREERGAQRDGEGEEMKAGWRCADGEDPAGDRSMVRKVRGSQTFSIWPVKTFVSSQ